MVQGLAGAAQDSMTGRDRGGVGLPEFVPPDLIPPGRILFLTRASTSSDGKPAQNSQNGRGSSNDSRERSFSRHAGRCSKHAVLNDICTQVMPMPSSDLLGCLLILFEGPVTGVISPYVNCTQ